MVRDQGDRPRAVRMHERRAGSPNEGRAAQETVVALCGQSCARIDRTIEHRPAGVVCLEAVDDRSAFERDAAARIAYAVVGDDAACLDRKIDVDDITRLPGAIERHVAVAADW